jgi:hypothetical protein
MVTKTSLQSARVNRSDYRVRVFPARPLTQRLNSSTMMIVKRLLIVELSGAFAFALLPPAALPLSEPFRLRLPGLLLLIA